MDKKQFVSAMIGGLVALVLSTAWQNYQHNNPRDKEGRQALIRELAEQDLDLIAVLQGHENMLQSHEKQLGGLTVVETK